MPKRNLAEDRQAAASEALAQDARKKAAFSEAFNTGSDEAIAGGLDTAGAIPEPGPVEIPEDLIQAGRAGVDAEMAATEAQESTRIPGTGPSPIAVRDTEELQAARARLTIEIGRLEDVVAETDPASSEYAEASLKFEAYQALLNQIDEELELRRGEEGPPAPEIEVAPEVPPGMGPGPVV